MPFTLPELTYPKNALEPHIDAATMEIHHGKHHAAYVSKANDALKGTQLESTVCPWQVCAHLAELPADKQGPIRNNAGGHANHSLFWETLAPAGQGGGGAPTGSLAEAINKVFGSFDAFKEQFTAAAINRFGSGWAWLCVNPLKQLHICSTANQDNPAMPKEFGGEGTGHRPILGLDVWEHAYYLKYQNRRPEYVAAFFHVVNWSKVAEHYQKALG